MEWLEGFKELGPIAYAVIMILIMAIVWLATELKSTKKINKQYLNTIESMNKSHERYVESTNKELIDLASRVVETLSTVGAKMTQQLSISSSVQVNVGHILTAIAELKGKFK